MKLKQILVRECWSSFGFDSDSDSFSDSGSIYTIDGAYVSEKAYYRELSRICLKTENRTKKRKVSGVCGPDGGACSSTYYITEQYVPLPFYKKN